MYDLNKLKQDMNEITCRWTTFNDLDVDLLYEVLQLRQEVFIVEQSCVVLDADGLDRNAHHLIARFKHDQKVCAYLRVVPPKREGDGAVIERLFVCKKHRRKGFGRQLMLEALKRIEDVFPGHPVKIITQSDMQRFYETFDFKASSEPYDKDGVEYIAMVKEGATSPDSVPEKDMQCPDSSRMTDFAEGYCTDQEKEEFLQHIKNCPDCYKKYVSLMMFSMKEKSEKEHGKIASLFRSRFNLLLFCGGLLAVVLAGWWGLIRNM